MDYDLNQRCDVHEDRYDCPDALINVVRGGYGLIIHDGGSSVIEIAFCPWCGSKLPKIADISGEDAPDPQQDTSEASGGVPARVLDFSGFEEDE